jgi:hypothetical protein
MSKISNSINLKIEPKIKVGFVTDKDVISLLSNNRKSFEAFLDANSKINPDLGKLKENKDMYEVFKNELTFLVEKVEIASFDCTMTPNFRNGSETLELFSDKYNTLGLECFNQYQENILNQDYDSQEFEEYINKFEYEDQRKIISPHISLRSNFRFYSAGKERPEPSDSTKKYFTKSIKKQVEKEQRLAMVDGNVDPNNGNFKVKNTVQFISNDDICNFKTILFNNTVFILKEKFVCSVKYEGGYYKIGYEPLNLLVWDSDFSKAKDEFVEYFWNTYQSYCVNNQEKLSKGAIEFKQRILNKIEKVINL